MRPNTEGEGIVLRGSCELWTLRDALLFSCWFSAVVCCFWCGLCYEGLVSYGLFVTHTSFGFVAFAVCLCSVVCLVCCLLFCFLFFYFWFICE